MNLSNKVVFIVGSTGIGGATARLAAQAGAQVFITSRTAENCRTLTDEINASGGVASNFAADQTQADQVQNAVDACIEKFGKIDASFNVAGISGRRFGDGPLHECSEEGWDVTLDTNAKGMFLFCRAQLKQMLQQPVGEDGLRGNILNMASVLGFAPQRDFFATHAYAASKGAIISMSRAMASYYAPEKIRVNVIAPSLVATPMSQRAQGDDEILNFMKRKQPLVEDLIPADDVARAALFLLSDEARVITGDILTVDAGWCVS
jgi:NAD(P)-dependent dehydrogenase (short-subunit alcohol dehydrogenase family)